ncbi:MAG: protein BatD [Chlorobi bacterium]|nr:protein BatD [Chlorobiota bacterium]
MMNVKKIIFLFVALIFSTLSFALQKSTKFVASTGNSVMVGERFRVTYELNANGSGFSAPNFGKLHRLSGPNTSQSSSVEYINGNYHQSVTQIFTYILTASEEGTYMISPASIVVDGETVRSNSLTIKVVKRSGNTAQAGSGNSTASQSGNNMASQKGSTSSNGALSDEDVFLKTIVSNRNPYLGEQIIITNRIYTKVGISNLSMDKSPSYEGFWSKSLSDDKQLKQSRQIIDGQEYIVADISKYALFPQKSGKLTIKPTELKCVAQIQVQNKRRRSRDPFDDFFNDPFFNRNIKNVDVFLSSKEITINVKPLPQEGKPESFTGAVGKFSFNAQLDHDTISTNDALTISVKLSGAGNLELVNPPKIKFPVDFETYDPKISNNIRTGLKGVSGIKKIEYLAIARNPGDFVIKPLEFSYFNPSDKKYHSISAGPYNIKVVKGAGSSGGGVSYSSSAQEDIKYIGKDIHHIKQTDFELLKVNDFLFGSPAYYLAIFVPLALLIVFVLVFRQQQKRKGNVALMKTRKANKIAKSKLLKAEKLMKANDDKEFYNELAQALWGYLSDKFLIPQAELSIENITDILTSRQVDDEITNGFVNALNNIEFARFAPGNAANKMKSIYHESLIAITLAEKALK